MLGAIDIDQNEFEKCFFSRNPPGSLDKLKKYTVGIAGAGGLGSSIAVSLVRAGIHKLIIADFDRIEISNLNRQQYFCEQIGQLKVAALRDNLLKINPYLSAVTLAKRICSDNVCSIFGDGDILVEAFDRADMKAMLANTWLQHFPERYLVMASGLSGYGMNATLHTEVFDKLVICGDQKTDSTPEEGLTAPRVAVVANLEANAVIEILMTGGISL